MDIESLTELKYIISGTNSYYDIIEPHIAFRSDITLYEYEAQKFEEMRLDSVMLNMYNGDVSVLKDMDVIIYINGIDNPLNIVEGMILLYPEQSTLQSFRLEPTEPKNVDTNITSILATPNKTTRKDSSRKSFVDNGYSLPPTVLEESKPAVTLNNGKIVVGGLN